MNFYELMQKTSEIYPALLLEDVCSHKFRKTTRKIILFLIFIAFILMIFNFFPEYVYNIRGLIFILFSLWVVLYLLDAMYFSYYFNKKSAIDFEIAEIILKTEDDITKTFLESNIGQYALLRLGLSKSDIKSFLDNKKNIITKDEFMIIENDKDPRISLSEYARSIIHFDIEFANFLKKVGVDANIWKNLIDWISRNQKKYTEREAWWHRDRLSRIPSLGRDWAYGQTYYLEKYGNLINQETIFQSITGRLSLFEDEVNNLERILSKQSGANALLISEQNLTAMQLICALGKEIENGTVRNEIEGKKIYVLDTNFIIDSLKEKINFENELNNIFVQTSRSGNVILVISDLPEFVENAAVLNSDVKDILNQVLRSDSVQLIAVSNSRRFHETLETNHDLISNFEKVLINDFEYSSIIQVIENEANVIESKLPVFFTYQSLIEIVKDAERFFADDFLYDKSIDLLNEVAVAGIVPKQKISLIDEKLVHKIIEKRTGIPQGEISNEEQSKLLNLEKILHQKIIGQELAINAISSAIRRSRIGLNDPKKPMATFLFLGPTGVGKTETTKALAEVFFGSQEKIIRIDMSEYSSEESLSKLIGSFEEKTPGYLSSKIREMQYGVLLLDEFEKSSRSVQDLFLQILDEGYFTDSRGERVNARNLIIIATSNAGSELIYNNSKNNQNLNQQQIVDEIINKGIYRPELINRFDGVIVFHPLDKNNLENVSKLMLNSFNERIKEKNIRLYVTDELINHLVKIGNNPQFGAREIRRVIQDVVEKKVVDSLISGEIKNGDEFVLVPDENSEILVKKKLS